MDAIISSLMENFRFRRRKVVVDSWIPGYKPYKPKYSFQYDSGKINPMEIDFLVKYMRDTREIEKEMQIVSVEKEGSNFVVSYHKMGQAGEGKPKSQLKTTRIPVAAVVSTPYTRF